MKWGLSIACAGRNNLKSRQVKEGHTASSGLQYNNGVKCKSVIKAASLFLLLLVAGCTKHMALEDFADTWPPLTKKEKEMDMPPCQSDYWKPISVEETLRFIQDDEPKDKDEWITAVMAKKPGDKLEWSIIFGKQPICYWWFFRMVSNTGDVLAVYKKSGTRVYNRSLEVAQS